MYVAYHNVLFSGYLDLFRINLCILWYLPSLVCQVRVPKFEFPVRV